MSNSTTRPAKPGDASVLAEMGSAFFAEAGLPAHGFTFCPDSFGKTVSALSERGLMLVTEHQGEVAGMIGVGFSPAWWNYSVPISQELFWFVRPDARRGRHGLRMLDAVEAEARARGVQLAGMAAEDGLRGETMAKVYRRRGYAIGERMFWKGL